MVQSFSKWVCLNTAKVLQKYQSGLFQDWVELWKKNVQPKFPVKACLAQSPKIYVSTCCSSQGFPCWGVGKKSPPQKSYICWYSYCSCTIFILISYSFDTQVMLILVLIEVQYSKSAVFNFEMSNSLLVRFSPTGKKIPPALFRIPSFRRGNLSSTRTLTPIWKTLLIDVWHHLIYKKIVAIDQLTFERLLIYTFEVLWLYTGGPDHTHSIPLFLGY